MQYIIHHTTRGIEAVAESDKELAAMLWGIEDARGVEVFRVEYSPETHLLHNIGVTHETAWAMWQSCSWAEVQDPDNPEMSFPSFLREHIDIRAQFRREVA